MRPSHCLAPLLPSLVLVLAAEAAAQACIGFPQGSRGALYAEFGFPENASSYTLAGMVSSRDGGLFFQGGFGITAFDVEQAENLKAVSGGMAFEIASLAPEWSVCPLAAATYAWVEDLNSLTVPFGVGIGTTVQLGAGGDAALTPFAVPQFLYARLSFDDVDDSAESDVFVGLGAGATVSVGSFLFGGQVSKVFEEDEDAVFSLVAGVAWRSS